jgi:hypothetical protein
MTTTKTLDEVHTQKELEGVVNDELAGIQELLENFAE